MPKNIFNKMGEGLIVFFRMAIGPIGIIFIIIGISLIKKYDVVASRPTIGLILLGIFGVIYWLYLLFSRKK